MLDTNNYRVLRELQVVKKSHNNLFRHLPGDAIGFKQERDKRAERATKACAAYSSCFFPFLFKAYCATRHNSHRVARINLTSCALSPKTQ